jgi:recombinational DNA repair ATPase RecF
MGATDAEDASRRALREGRAADRAAGRTLSGPHLTDLAVTHLPKSAAAAQCSTGEQKALLIGVVLAHARLIATINGETPLILLDEVAAHLDPSRREALFGILLDLGAQAWMTGTEADSFAPFGASVQHFQVQDGAVTGEDRQFLLRIDVGPRGFLRAFGRAMPYISSANLKGGTFARQSSLTGRGTPGSGPGISG